MPAHFAARSVPANSGASARTWTEVVRADWPAPRPDGRGRTAAGKLPGHLVRRERICRAGAVAQARRLRGAEGRCLADSDRDDLVDISATICRTLSWREGDAGGVGRSCHARHAG